MGMFDSNAFKGRSKTMPYWHDAGAGFGFWWMFPLFFGSLRAAADRVRDLVRGALVAAPRRAGARA
jgi:hypothetical protein